MDEKIKVSVPKSTYDIIMKDCENFLFTKQENSLNKNLFINTLIVNYYEEFSLNEERFHDELNKVLGNNSPYIDDIIKVISKREKSNEADNESVYLLFKPTKLSMKAIEFIDSVLIKNESVSSFYRRLFNAYAHHPQNKRELIIFKDNYTLLNKAISKNVCVCLSYGVSNIIKEASVYALSSSNDELFNYVLFTAKNTTFTVRLAKIKNVSLLAKERNISLENIEIFKKQIKYGAQYPIDKSENETIMVRMSEQGKELFKKIYLYRPTVEKIENDIYYFNCSYNQVVHYFKRFGSDAVIISPQRLANLMRNYYYFANKEYQKKNNL